MTGMAHAALHLALCGRITRLAPQADVAVHVRVSDRINRTLVNQSYTLKRGYGDESVVEFDAPQGVYHLDVSVSRYGCGASDFIYFMPDHTRNISERLQSSSSAQYLPLMLSGTTPPAFSYAHPEFVLIDKNAQCNKPIPNVSPLRATIENDQDAYYAALDPQPQNAAVGSFSVVMKLRTAAAQYHYVRIPVTLPIPRTNWPGAYGLNIPEDFIDAIATDPVDTLLCPHFLKTSVS